jgi:F0F1-type ATP synthase membrane subunit a
VGKEKSYFFQNTIPDHSTVQPTVTVPRNKSNSKKGKENKENSFIVTSLFLIILTDNFLGLNSYIFTRTRHLTLTLTLALPL